ncbi:hypothetical protein [Deinococcus sp. S9]|uniref:hypothetical protein n=1 Tax=Deinococcus sp. S9 TaxID=2545754 RepID=UPI00197F100A|nr:hypothetical protein [Deinococcus sp. S9]
MDSNDSKARDIGWARVDPLIWLDDPAPVVFARLLRRRRETPEQLARFLHLEVVRLRTLAGTERGLAGSAAKALCNKSV